MPVTSFPYLDEAIEAEKKEDVGSIEPNSGGNGIFNNERRKKGKGRPRKCSLCDRYDCTEHNIY